MNKSFELKSGLVFQRRPNGSISVSKRMKKDPEKTVTLDIIPDTDWCKLVGELTLVRDPDHAYEIIKAVHG
jgi:hypothetical protein